MARAPYSAPGLLPFQNPVSDWVAPRRNALLGFGAGMLSPNLGDASTGAMQGMALDRQYGQEQQDFMQQQEETNATKDWLRQRGRDDLLPLVDAGQGMFALQQATAKQEAPEFGFTFAPDGTLIRTDKSTGTFAQMGQFAPAPDPNDSPTVQKVTLDDGSEMAVQWDGSTQQWVPINAPQGGGSLRPDKLTENQSKLTLFQTLQTETQPVLLDLETQFDPANVPDAAARSTPIAGNFFQSEQGQIYNAAAAAWAEGALRIATGAAATPEEMQRTIRTYFAQPGDTPNTIAFKTQMREMYSRAINNSLGRPNGSGRLPLPSEFAGGITNNQLPATKQSGPITDWKDL